ncbi:MAG: HEPN domain-containing protein [Cyclobacteriaceae bacterium]|nr:HEPN domain-containing protein [Cyclobacteriaceae bacterium]
MNDLIKDWIEKADHDFGSAKLIFIHVPDYYDTIAFHCQQAAEKYLKALLIYYEIEFQRSHNLIYLLDLLSDKIEISEDIYDNAILLNGFSVQIRYPDRKIYLSKDELETSISITQKFREFTINKIGIN